MICKAGDASAPDFPGARRERNRSVRQFCILWAVAAFASPSFAEPARDLYGDALPDGAAARYGTTRLRHPRHAWAMAISPDKTRLAAADGLNRVLMWEIPTGRRLWAHTHPFAPLDLAFWPDGKALAASVPSSGVVLHDANSGAVLHTLEPKDRVADHVLLVSRDGRHMFASGTTIRVFDLQARKLQRELGGFKGVMAALDLSPDGTLLAAGGVDESLWVWDWATGKEKARLPLPEKAPIAAVSFSRDGKLIAAGHRGYGEPVYNETRTAIVRQVPHPPAVMLWDLVTGKSAGRIEDASYPRFLADGKDNLLSVARYIGGASWALAWASPTTGKVTRAGILLGQRWRWSDDDKLLAVASSEFGLDLLAMPEGTSLLGSLPGHHNAVGCLAVSPDGRHVVTGHGMASAPWPEKHAAFVWETATGKLVRELGDANSGTITAAAFSADGTELAAGFHDGRVRTFDAVTWRIRRTLNVASDPNATTAPATQPASRKLTPIRFVAWLGGNAKLIVSNFLGVVSLWDAATACKLADLDLSPTLASERDRAAVFGRGGKSADLHGFLPTRLAIHGGVMFVKSAHRPTIREAATGELIVRARPFAVGSQCCVISPDGLLAIGGSPNGMVVFWEFATGLSVNYVGPPRIGHDIGAIAVSPDSRTFATAGRDKTILLWDLLARSPRAIAALTGHESEVSAVVFAPDGRFVISGSADCTALRWDTAKWTAPPPPPKTPAPVDLGAQWQALADPDGRAGWLAQRALVHSPFSGDAARVSAFLAQRVQPVAVDRDKLASAIAALDAPTAAARDTAQAELASLGCTVEAELRKALAETKSAEVRARLEILLKVFDDPMALPPKDMLRPLRAIAILSAIGTEDARAVLKKLAAGAPSSPITRAAKSRLP